MSRRPDLSIVILSWNTQGLLRACLDTVVGHDHGLTLEVIVVDNGSEDGSPDMVEQDYPAVRLIRNSQNEGYARANNQGLRECTAPYLMLLNSDTEIQGTALLDLVEFLEQNREYGVVAPRLVSPDGSVQRTCMRFPTLTAGLLQDSFVERWFGRPAPVRAYFMEDFDHLSSRDVDQPPGAACLFRREVYERIGGLDEDLWLFFNDVDFCQRVVRAGWKVRYLAEAAVLHHVGGSTSKFRGFVGEWNVNRVRYYRKWFGRIGAFGVKTMVILRALEELGRILLSRPDSEWRPAYGEIRRVIARTLQT